MESITRAFARFVERDTFYIIGGLSVLWSIGLIFGHDFLSDTSRGAGFEDPFLSLSTATILILVVISYVLAICIQVIFGLTPIVNTGLYYKKNRFLKFWYEKETRKNWPIIEDDTNLDDIYYEYHETIDKDKRAAFDRQASLKHIGHTVGSCWMVTSIIVFFYSWKYSNQDYVLVGAIIFALSVILILEGWIKGIQISVQLAAWKKRQSERISTTSIE